MVCIGIWIELRIYRVTPDTVRWSCRGFLFLWRSFVLDCMPWTNNDLKVSHRKHVNDISNMKLVTSLMNFECQSCGIFEVLSYHQEDEVIDPIIFADTVGLLDRINKLVSSNFMVVVRSFSVIFYTGDTYSRYCNKGTFLTLKRRHYQ